MTDQETTNREKLVLPIFGTSDVAVLTPEPLVVCSDPFDFNPDYKFDAPKGFTMTASATIDKGEDVTIASIARQLNSSELTMEVTPSIRHLPRKMKKAIIAGSRYHRDTRWKRKAAQWKKRNKLTLLGNITSDGNGDYTFTGRKVE